MSLYEQIISRTLDQLRWIRPKTACLSINEEQLEEGRKVKICIEQLFSLLEDIETKLEIWYVENRFDEDIFIVENSLEEYIFYREGMKKVRALRGFVVREGMIVDQKLRGRF